MGFDPDGSITINTFGDLIDEGYRLSAYCRNRPACGRPLELDVYDLAERFGRAANFIRTRFPIRCSACGSRDIGYVVNSDSRPIELLQRDGPGNMRRSRTPEERAVAKAMIAPEARWRFGLDAPGP